MSRRLRRPHRLAFRLTAEQMDQVEALAKHWGTSGKTHTITRMIEHCGWELLVGPREAAKQAELPKKPHKNGDEKRMPKRAARARKAVKP